MGSCISASSSRSVPVRCDRHLAAQLFPVHASAAERDSRHPGEPEHHGTHAHVPVADVQVLQGDLFERGPSDKDGHLRRCVASSLFIGSVSLVFKETGLVW